MANARYLNHFCHHLYGREGKSTLKLEFRILWIWVAIILALINTRYPTEAKKWERRKILWFSSYHKSIFGIRLRSIYIALHVTLLNFSVVKSYTTIVWTDSKKSFLILFGKLKFKLLKIDSCITLYEQVLQIQNEHFY